MVPCKYTDTYDWYPFGPFHETDKPVNIYIYMLLCCRLSAGGFQ